VYWTSAIDKPQRKLNQFLKINVAENKQIALFGNNNSEFLGKSLAFHPISSNFIKIGLPLDCTTTTSPCPRLRWGLTRLASDSSHNQLKLELLAGLRCTATASTGSEKVAES